MSKVVAVRDDGSYEGATGEDLAAAGLDAVKHPTMEGWLLLTVEGLHGSDPDDVDFDLAMNRFECRIQEDGHPFTDAIDSIDCVVKGCGLEARDHIPAVKS